ncbi:UvrD-helicase domain-containing protein [Leptospira adleri]|uniref:UvrD-helicase domain-containing protein n=1 Tax=Leptospira adleri TaxID=2023186 RepID=UPI001082C168|nr:ATP-dependent helicase [Leptospira adleri]TGM58559.1 ATP-dependent helicase [Leptospira adleri]
MFESLSEKQREIVFNKSGKFVVRACPGSGKTYCVSARIAHLINCWRYNYQGIAALSFTNVAWKEIERHYFEVFNIADSIRFPHFLGTIDSFINRYIFLPYGHLVMNCKVRPILVGEPHGSWTGKTFSDNFFDYLSFDINGNLYSLNPRSMPSNWSKNSYIKNVKLKFNKLGYATQADANYYAVRILEKYPRIAKSLVDRFPNLVVDEAQDTSEIQMRIVELLIENGLEEVMLIGDPDQAIFEWNMARPDLLEKKYTEWSNSVQLNENRRSSQNVCNFTYKLSSLPEPSNSVDDKVKSYIASPEIIKYSLDTLPNVVLSFLQKCTQEGIEVNPKNVAVLYRSKSILNFILKIDEPPYVPNIWPKENNYTRDFAKGKYIYDNGDVVAGFRLIERAVVKLKYDLPSCREEDISNVMYHIGIGKFRSLIYKCIHDLPESNIKIGNWIDIANEKLSYLFNGKKLKIEQSAKEFHFNQIFTDEKSRSAKLNYRLGTIHSAKGETFEATLLILKATCVGNKKYKTLLTKNTPIKENEELRMVYVGLTRPRKLLLLAVPDEENKGLWEKKFFE